MSKGTIVFLAANASYSHTNLAGWYLRAYAEDSGWRWHEVEILRSDSFSLKLQRVLELEPDVLAASFYLFNRQYLLSFIKRFKALRPDCRVIGGGPEFLGDNVGFLAQIREINALIRGEGELAFPAWLACNDQPEKWRGIKGLCAFVGKEYIDNGRAETVENLDEIPSPYESNLMHGNCDINGKSSPDFFKPFLLLETSRGCSNHCGFCTSAGERVRVFSLERVRADLASIAAAGVGEIRLVDRTFNENTKRCLELLRIMRTEFPGVRFHLEIDPARLSDEMMNEFLASAPGKFHLEIGLQTMRADTLKALGRFGAIERSLAALAKLCRMKKPAVHVDLIAGLPEASIADLYHDLGDLVKMEPDEIQLESLKILPGTRLGAEMEKWGIVCAPEPPYEVLKTSAMSSADMLKAKILSNITDWFYNTRELKRSLTAANRLIPDFIVKFADHCAGAALPENAPALEERFRMLERFVRGCGGQDLLCTLGYEWLKWGLSAQHGIFSAMPWKERIPANAVLVEGENNFGEGKYRVYLADLGKKYLFVYGRYPRREACAIYELR